MEYLLVNKKPNAVWVTEKDISSEWISSEYYDPKFLEIEKNFLINKFDIYKFDEIADINRVSGFEVEKYLEIVNEGVPYLRVKNIGECFVEHDDLYHIPQYVHQKFKKSQFKKNDIAMTITGRVGTAALINEEITEYNASQDVVKISLKKRGIDPYYLTIYLNSRINHSLLSRFNSGGSRQRTLINNVREVSIPIPSPEIQKYIGDKVRKAEELREEAKKLKKEAENKFNDIYKFEVNKTVKNKIKWVKNQFLSEDNTTFNFYRQYEILNNESVEYYTINEVQEEVKCGQPVKKDLREGNKYPFYGASGVSDSIDEYNFDGDYLIIAQDGSIGKVNVARGKFWANNHVWIVKLKKKWDLEFIELYLNKYPYWISLTTGSVVPKVTSENLKRILIPSIDYKEQEDIGENIRISKNNEYSANILIQEAKKDVEDLIEGNFDMSKLNQS